MDGPMGLVALISQSSMKLRGRIGPACPIVYRHAMVYRHSVEAARRNRRGLPNPNCAIVQGPKSEQSITPHLTDNDYVGECVCDC